MAKVRSGRRASASRPLGDVAPATAAEPVVSSAIIGLPAPTQPANNINERPHADAGREVRRSSASAGQTFVRDAILVLGMHRSGTSALTGTLVRLGAIGPGTPMAADQGNERGYFESVPFMLLHDQLLASAGSCWDDWRRFDPDWLTSFEAEKFRAEARKLLLDEFGDAKLLILKDPRACRFVPFWKSVLAEARAALRVVIPLRSPIAVARSLRARDGMPLTKGLLLWLRHTLEAERETRDVPRAIVEMDEFLSDWRSETSRIADEIGLAWPRDLQVVAPEIDAFLSTDLVHQHATEDENQTLHSWAFRAYTALLTLAHKPEAPHARATLDEIASAFESSCGFFGALLSEVNTDIEALRGREAAARLETDTAREQLGTALATMEAERKRSAEHKVALEAMLSEARAAADATATLLSEATAGVEAERCAAVERIASLSTALDAAAAASNDREANVARLNQDAAEAESRFGALRQTLHRQEAEIGRLQAELEGGRERIVGDAARLSVLERLRAEQVEGLIETRRQLVQERDRADAAVRDLANRSATVDVLDAALRDERGLRSNFEARLSSLVEGTVRLEARLSGLSHQLDQRNLELVEARDEAARAAQRLAQESGRADEVETARAALAEAMERAEAERAELLDRLAATEKALGEASSLQASLTRDLDASAAAARLADERAAGLRQDFEKEQGDRTARLETAEQDLAHACARTEELQRLLADQQHRAEAAERAIQQLQTEVQHRERGEMLRENELAALLKSPSWQLTRPLRAAAKALSRLKRGLRYGRTNPLFDTNWYLEQYRDVRLSGWDPYAHYLRHGTTEGRDPNPLFDTDWYLEQNLDVRESGMNPLLHYWRYGEKEGRNPHSDFATSWYLSQYEDVRASSSSALLHYIIHGKAARFLPKPPASGEESYDIAENFSESYLTPVILELHYSETASPLSVGQNDDTRQLALYFRRMRVRGGGDLIADIDFRAGGNARSYVLFGFSEIEPAGTWSLGGKSALLLWADLKSDEPLEVELDASHFNHGFPKLAVTLSTSHGQSCAVHLGREMPSLLSATLDPGNRQQSFFASSAATLCPKNVSKKNDAVPVVSIIILNFNKSNLSILSALSVISAQIPMEYEILIVDNGSSEEHVSALRSSSIDFRVVETRANRFFGEGNNIGAESARGQYLLFLNNDAFIAPGLVEELYRAFEENPSCGAAGPVFRYPDGALQEAGAFIRVDGRAFQRGKRDPNFDVTYLPRFDTVDYVSAACLMIPAQTFKRLGGFNHRYDPAYYEDTDLCMRVRLLDQVVILASRATCYHIENATTSDKKHNSGANNVVEHNREVFLSTWRAYLSSRLQRDLPTALLAPVKRTSSASRLKSRNAVFSPYALTPGGGERYILATAGALSSFGSTDFVSPDHYSGLRLHNVMHDLGLAPADLGTRAEAEASAIAFDRFVLMGNELFPSRASRAKLAYFHCQFPFPYASISEDEIRRGAALLDSYAGVIVNSEFTREAYEGLLKEYGLSKKVHVVYPPVASEELVRLRERARKPQILSIGRFTDKGHAKRQDVLIEAFRRTSPQFRSNWKLVLCGAVPNDPDARSYFAHLRATVGSDLPVEFVVSPSREVVQELLAESAVYAHGTGFGVTSPREYWKCEHFGITVVEGLAAGCEVYAYEVGGPKEIFERVGAGQAFKSIDELAFLFENSSQNGLDSGVRRRASGHFSDQAFAKRMRALF